MMGQIVILVCSLYLSLVQCQDHGPISASFFTPYNIRYQASTFHSTANITSRVIHFSPGGENDLLIEIPLGHQDPKTVYVITIGLDSSHPNTYGIDADLGVGISDGTNNNIQLLVDINNYPTLSPCYPINGSSDGVLVPGNTKVPSTFTLTFIPYWKYAACETAQGGGYLNTGTFDNKIDPEKPVFVRVFRHHASEQVFIRCLKVESFV